MLHSNANHGQGRSPWISQAPKLNRPNLMKLLACILIVNTVEALQTDTPVNAQH